MKYWLLPRLYYFQDGGKVVRKDVKLIGNLYVNQLHRVVLAREEDAQR